MILRSAALVLLLSALPGLGQALDPEAGVPQPPAVWAGGRPNMHYGDELLARIKGLTPAQRDPFFRRLREQQRSMRRQIEAAERDLREARDLHKNLSTERSPLQRDTEALVDAQTRILDGLRSLDRIITALRKDHDPQRVDADELRVDLYGGFQFSSLFRDPGATSGGFFSKSRPFAALDIRQTYRRIGDDKWVEAFGTLSFQSSTLENSEATTIITTTGHVRAEVGAWWMKALNDRVSYGLDGAVGMVGYTQPVMGPDGTPQDQDSFRSRWRLGATVRQEVGAVKGSFAEVAYVRDPLFLAKDRFFLRGRVVLTQFGSEGASGDFYTEGTVSKGRKGRDEAVLLVGIRLSTVAFFRSLGAGRWSD
jgi:Spy/CpxP family protein refolding chaperone